MPSIIRKKREAERTNQASQAHQQRVHDELRQSGTTVFGRTKFSSQYLHHVIHDDEHIRGAVHGRYRYGCGVLSFSEGMLVATDRRIIFLDYKPAFTSVEQIPYSVVSGVEHTTAGPFSSVTLYTKIGNFSLSYANSKCVRNFVDHIENRRIKEKEVITDGEQAAQPLPAADTATAAIQFLRHRDICVISTTDPSGNIHGAAVYYLIGADSEIFILTKGGTQKAHDILATHKAAMTVYDGAKMQTVQLHGTAEIETRQEVKNWVFGELIRPRSDANRQQLPPATLLHEGAFTIFRITPESMRFIDFTHAA